MDGIAEQAVLFGRSRSLVGIIARPSSDPAPRRPAVVILNSGIVHRVGHHRMYVTMARQLAAAGHYVLRFDFSGIGDSRSRGGDLSPIAGFQTDIVEAFDWLATSYGASSFVLVGLCAGADIALRYGHSDKRVVGLVLLDPTIPPTARFYAHYIGQRLIRLHSWLSFARGRGRIWQDAVELLRSATTTKPSGSRTSLLDPRMRSELEHIYRSLVTRGTRLLVVLAGGPLQGRQSYREQLLEAFPNVPFEDKLSLEHFANSDHTFTLVSDRERLNELVLTWIGTTPFDLTTSSEEASFGSGDTGIASARASISIGTNRPRGER